jgi:hypothetical protein
MGGKEKWDRGNWGFLDESVHPHVHKIGMALELKSSTSCNFACTTARKGGEIRVVKVATTQR